MRGCGDPPPGDPNHTQAMHYRRNQRGGESAKGHRGQRSQDEDAEKWNDVGEGDRERAKGNSLGLFLQIVLLQTLAG